MTIFKKITVGQTNVERKRMRKQRLEHFIMLYHDIFRFPFQKKSGISLLFRYTEKSKESHFVCLV